MPSSYVYSRSTDPYVNHDLLKETAGAAILCKHLVRGEGDAVLSKVRHDVLCGWRVNSRSTGGLLQEMSEQQESRDPYVPGSRAARG